MLALYGHPFSSYTWKALIALYANATPFEFRITEPDHPDHIARVAGASPAGKFPLLVDGDAEVFEASVIVEYLDLHHPGPMRFVPDDRAGALHARMMDRVFDNYVMNTMQDSVAEAIREGTLGAVTRDRVNAALARSYAWIERWLAGYRRPDGITLIECAAAPSLFYADWVMPIPPEFLRLREWRAHLLALPPVSRCVEDARPYRHYFPLGAPDRD